MNTSSLQDIQQTPRHYPNSLTKQNSTWHSSMSKNHYVMLIVLSTTPMISVFGFYSMTATTLPKHYGQKQDIGSLSKGIHGLVSTQSSRTIESFVWVALDPRHTNTDHLLISDNLQNHLCAVQSTLNLNCKTETYSSWSFQSLPWSWKTIYLKTL